MFHFEKLKFSWSLAGAIASVVALISLVHLFVYPIVPSLDYLSAQRVQNSCLPLNGSSEGGTSNGQGIKSRVDLVNQFPADSHYAVVYRGAPWKARIGRWLSGCDSVTEEVNVVEVIKTKILSSSLSTIDFLEAFSA